MAMNMTGRRKRLQGKAGYEDEEWVSRLKFSLKRIIKNSLDVAMSLGLEWDGFKGDQSSSR